MLRVVVALAVLGVLGWWAMQRFLPGQHPPVDPVKVEVKVPNPLGGGEAPPGDRVYVP